MNIGPTDGVPGPGRVERPSKVNRVPPPPPATGAEGADRVEISDAARLLAEVMNAPGVRQDRVEELRRLIESGQYDTPERLQGAIDNFLKDNADLL